MNKVDAFFVMFAALFVWLFCVWLLPTTIMVFVYAGISALTVGMFIGSLPDRLAKRTEKDLNRELSQVVESQLALSRDMLAELIRRTEIIRGSQAIIDRLMFEYCPEEMTAEQIANFEAHVKAVSPEQEETIKKTLLN